MFKADGSRRDFPVTKPRIVVGRTNDCDLRIPLSSVSRQHCEFRLENNQFKLHDLGSSNGTFRNNTRISQETLLQPGDEVVIGPVVFTVVVDGKPTSIDPVRTVLDRNKASVHGGASSASAVVEPQRLSFETGVSMPVVEEESYSPTVDLDEPDEALTVDLDNDDPIAALEALAAGTNHAPAHMEPPAAVEEDDVLLPLADEDDDDDADVVIPMLDEEDEDLPMLAEEDDDDLLKP